MICDSAKSVLQLRFWLTFFVLVTHFHHVTAQETSWQEYEFLDQLNANGLSVLAEVYVNEKRRRADTPDSKARWQLRLSQQTRDHIWQVPASERAELLEHDLEAVVEIAGVQDSALSFRLQTESTRSLLAESEVALLTTEASTLYQGTAKADLAIIEKRIQQLRTERERLQSAVSMLNRRGSGYSPTDTARLRDESRLLIGRLYCQQCYWVALSTDTKRDTVHQEARDFLRSVIRKARDPDIRRQLQYQLAEMGARYDSPKDFRLLMAPFSSQEDRLKEASEAALRIRFLLTQKQPDAAANLLPDGRQFDEVLRQKFGWLSAEILIGQVIQAKRLEDDTRIEAAWRKVEALKVQVSSMGNGAYAEAIRRCLAKAEMILTLGSKMAERLDAINEAQRRGDLSQASLLLQQALDQLPQDVSLPARCALLLKSTEVLLQLKDWSQAIAMAKAATDGYLQAKQPDKAAAADLLRCFALAQQMATMPESRSAYIKALKNHLEAFPDSPSAVRASEWLFRVLETSAPSEAVELAIRRMEVASTTEVSRLRQTVAKLIWSSLLNQSHVTSRQLNAWADQLSGPAGNSVDLLFEAHLALILITSTLTDAELSAFRQQLPVASTEPSLQRLLLDTVMAARLTSKVDDLVTSRFIKASKNEREQVMNFLSHVVRQMQPTDDIANGDIAICRLTDRLIIRQLSSAQRDLSVALQWMPVVSASATVTGDQQALSAVASVLTLDSIDDQSMDSIVRQLKQVSDSAQASAPLKSVVTGIWKRIVQKSVPGSDHWLEGLVQLGELVTDPLDREQLLKQMQTASVLYPEWGNSDRKARAARTLQRLKERTRP